MSKNLQELNNEHFNKMAQDYDNIPQVKVFTQKSAEAILKGFKDATSEERLKNASVLDFGCGTGLCALFIAPQVKHVLGVDASEGMLEFLNLKLSTQPEFVDLHTHRKVDTVCHLVSDAAPLPEKELAKYVTGADSQKGFDFVYSNFVMHHIEDVQSIVNTLAKNLVKEDGWLIISDFEGGHGHEPSHGNHHHHAHGHSHHHHEEAKEGEEKRGHAHGEHHHHHHHEHAAKKDGEHKHDHGEHHNHDDHDHHEGQETDEVRKGERLSEHHFKDEDGKDLAYVAHKGGFTLEGFEEILRNAGLVDVKAYHCFGMNREMHGKTLWTDVFVAQGRRPVA
ncbi:hypothetical protein BGZ83_000141 [Gryganskiella cystojenkinii]|nr:hypothetical protein BGZ83_000141 [Gryganskiella cystojenkinii]